MKHPFATAMAGALVLGACQADVRHAGTSSGDVAASPVGFASTDRVADACGSGHLTLAGELQIDRKPYMQRVSATSAMVLFTARGGGPAPSVDLTRPDGRHLQSVHAEVDSSDANGRQWIARFSGLEPDSVYCYTLDQLTEPTAFRTAPAAGQDTPVRFVVFGDSGGGRETQDAVRAQLDGVSFDLMLHTGDIAYGSGTLPEFESRFFAEYAELLRSIPMFPASGNHDNATDDGAPYRQVFALPENGAPDGLERWYSFDWGDVHFIALDTERVNEAQTLWLERDLVQNTLPWTVAYMHRPAYSSGVHGSSEGVREAFAPLFADYGVQVVFAGHDHDYERTVAIDGVTYIVTGGGGYGTRPVGSSSFTARSEEVLHFVYGEFVGQRLVLHAIDSVGDEFDSVLVERFPTGELP